MKNDPHFKLGYAISTIQSLIKVIEREDTGVVAEIENNSALEVAKDFLAENQ